MLSVSEKRREQWNIEGKTGGFQSKKFRPNKIIFFQFAWLLHEKEENEIDS